MDRARIIGLGKGCLTGLLFLILLYGCGENKKVIINPEELAVFEPEDIYEFGFNLNDYYVIRDTIRKGDNFGLIMERNKIGYPKIYEIVQKSKDSFNVRSLQIGKPYTILCSKDTLQNPQCFIYQPTKEEYVVINFQDSIHAYRSRKPIKYVEKEISGIIDSSISQTLDEQGISPIMAYQMSDIYAWTIDFFRLQKGDRFKVIYTDKYIDDTIYAGIDNIKATFFEHNGEDFYAFKFETDSVKHLTDYFNEEAKTLRRAFLKAPVEYKRISSRYNLNRRIALYGNKVRPHKGTDFAADIGTPIRATANGTVTKSSYTRGNGNYVKIRHNSIYETQYLHMKKQNVKAGQYVRQGDVIGWVGMTGNTSGPHVCYRFWKNGEQVDPFKQKLPEAEPIADDLKLRYLDYIAPIKKQLDGIKFPNDPIDEINDNLITQAN